MSRAYAMNLARPREALNIPLPIGRKLLAMSRRTWVFLLMTVTVACASVYIYQVNTNAAKSVSLRRLQSQLDYLNDLTASLETQRDQLQALHSLQDRATALGYVPVDQYVFVNAAGGAYAMAK